MTPKEKEEMRKIGFSEEEIKSGKIEIFEHLVDKSYKPKLITYLRLLDIIPMIEQEVLDKTIECLEAKHIFKQIIKLNLNDISRKLFAVNTALFKAFEKNNKSAEAFNEREKWYNGYQDLALKFTDALISFVEGIEVATNVSESIEPVKRENIILDKATFLGKLKPGQIFFFADIESYCEYTFVKSVVENDEIKCYYHKINNNDNKVVDFYDTEILRPVIVTDLLTEEQRNEVKKIISTLFTFNNI